MCIRDNGRLAPELEPGAESADGADWEFDSLRALERSQPSSPVLAPSSVAPAITDDRRSGIRNLPERTLLCP